MRAGVTWVYLHQQRSISAAIFLKYPEVFSYFWTLIGMQTLYAMKNCWRKTKNSLWHLWSLSCNFLFLFLHRRFSLHYTCSFSIPMFLTLSSFSLHGARCSLAQRVWQYGERLYITLCFGGRLAAGNGGSVFEQTLARGNCQVCHQTMDIV